MATTQKAIRIAQALQEEIAKRLSTKTVSFGFDTDGHPYVTMNDGSAASGEANVYIKVRPFVWGVVTDVLGSAQQVYSPHVIQFCTEANYAATTDNVADNLTRAQLLACLAPCILKGCKLEWYQESYGTAPTSSTIDSSKLVASFDDLSYPMVGAQ